MEGALAGLPRTGPHAGGTRWTRKFLRRDVRDGLGIDRLPAKEKEHEEFGLRPPGDVKAFAPQYPVATHGSLLLRVRCPLGIRLRVYMSGLKLCDRSYISYVFS